ncbi:minor tail protein [Rhodococcus phage Jflix2]|nr:minor tail protein [Rhodococcus phage Jflix2]
MSSDSLKWYPTVTVAKFNPETVADITRSLGHRPTAEDYARITPDEVVVAEGNSLTSAGLDRITALITGGAGNPFSSAKGLIGVGNGTTGFSAAQTDLTGASKLFVPVTSAAAAGSGTGKISASALFLGTDANFAWEEWCFVVATGTPRQERGAGDGGRRIGRHAQPQGPDARHEGLRRGVDTLGRRHPLVIQPSRQRACFATIKPAAFAIADPRKSKDSARRSSTWQGTTRDGIGSRQTATPSASQRRRPVWA